MPMVKKKRGGYEQFYEPMGKEAAQRELAELKRESEEELRAALGPEFAQRLNEMMERKPEDRQPISANVPVSLIRRGIRDREEMGDIEALAQDIDKRGLLLPIRILPDGDIVFGERRLKAIRLLGWKTIPALIMPARDLRGDEAAENLMRLDLTPEEKYYATLRLLPVLKEEAKQRQQEAGQERGRSMKASGQLPEASKGAAVEQATKRLGWSRASFKNTGKILEAAADEPEAYDDLRERMNTTRNIHGSYAKLQVRQRQKEMRDVPLPKGKYRCIVIDPPWPVEKVLPSPGEDPSMDYATNTLEKIEEKVGALLKKCAVEEGTHIYLWTTQPFLGEAFRLFDAWGVRYGLRTLTWEKRNKNGKLVGANPAFKYIPVTEFVVFGQIGTLDFDRIGLPTHFQGLRRKHSQKPEEFYKLVAEASPGPYLDAYSRGGHGPEWASWGDEADLFETEDYA